LPEGAGAVEGVGLVGAGVVVPEPVVRAPPAVPVVGEVAAPVVAGGVVGACATLLLPPPQPAHHHTPMPIATSTMMPMIHAPELSSRTRRLSGSYVMSPSLN
jgi:hypothetical protein